MNEQLEIIHQSTTAIEQITRGEIDVQIATARRFPRNVSGVRNEILSLATYDEQTAASCFYSLPRGGKAITGESVRFAEILASSYGNIRSGARPVGFDRASGTVTVQGVCHDLEKNVSVTIEKTRQVQKKKNKDGSVRDDYDPDMINLAINSGSAIAFRDAVFKVVPKAFYKPILDKIKEAARGKGTLGEKVENVVKRLESMGAKRKNILAAVGAVKMEDINLDALDTLIGLGTAIKDGEVRLDEAFPDAVKIKEAEVSKSAIDEAFGGEA